MGRRRASGVEQRVVRTLESVVVATTRAEDPDDALVAGLRAKGALVRTWATLRFLPARDREPLEHAVNALRAGAFEWIALTSPRAVDPVTELAPTSPDGVRVAAVGRRTADTLLAAGWHADVVGEGGASELVAAMAGAHDLRGARVLFAAGSLAGPTLQEALAEAGSRVTRVEAYRTEALAPDAERVHADLEAGVDVVVFASPSAVDGLRRALAAAWPAALAGCATVAIGASTGSALLAAGIREPLVAGEPTADGLLEACRRVVAREVTR